MLELIKKEKKKLAGPLSKKELPAKGCSRKKKIRGRRRYQMIDKFMINGLY